MEQCQKIERVTRFGIYFPIRSQPDKAGIPYVLTDWGIKNRFWKRYHMKKNIILWMAALAVVMLAFPWLAVTFVKGDAGMAVCFLLFFAVNPLYSVLIGAFAGKDIRRLWSLPVISAVLFFIGTWIFFDMGDLYVWNAGNEISSFPEKLTAAKIEIPHMQERHSFW